MTTTRHDPDSLPEPAVELLAVARSTVPPWLRRCTEDVARRHRIDLDEHGDELAGAVVSAADSCLRRLEVLLGTDVDEQRTNPLSLLRDAVVEPSRVLLDLGAAPARVDEFQQRRFPDDPFGLGPANWNEVHPDLHAAGITWGAWKAMTVLRRRRVDHPEDGDPGAARRDASE